MVEQKVVLDPAQLKYFVPGPGGYSITLSPGSKVYELERAQSGHLMLPVTEWHAKKSDGMRRKHVTFNTHAKHE